MAYSAKNVINGTYGEVWLNSDYVAESTALQLKISLDKQDVTMCRKLTKGKKIVGYSGTGTIKMNKINSRIISLYKDLKKGKIPDISIISKLSDPDALGSERIKVTGVIFDEISLADWEASKLGEESINFTFEDYELIDTIKT